MNENRHSREEKRKEKKREGGKEIKFCYKHVFACGKNFQRTGRIARTIKFHKALNNISLQIFDWVSLALKKRREKVFCVLDICLYIGKTHGTQC